MKKEYTATAYVIDDAKALLIFHRKLKKWLPPGGHIDENELPSDAAKREVYEETGIQIELVSDENTWIERWNARSIPRPFMCLLEEIPPYKDIPAHQHIDFIYLGKPLNGNISACSQEVDAARWFSWEEIDSLLPDEEIFVETKETLRKILIGNFILLGSIHA